MMQRRDVAKEFLFGSTNLGKEGLRATGRGIAFVTSLARLSLENPHLRKETLRAIGCGIALIIALLGYLYADHRLDLLAYLVLIPVLVINEWFSVRWRYAMYWEMKAVDDKQA